MAVHERVVEATLGRPRMELLRGDRLLSRGDLDGAVAAYRAAQTQGLDTPELWLRLGSVSERTGRVEEARSWYQRVLAQPSTGSVQDEALKGFARQGVERLSALGGERSP
jgi:tetratricopeptide (TPR) repeat protein